jgi:hypothetical protein
MKNETKLLTMISVATALLLMTLITTSCATNGYGCKGRGKLITRVPQ